MVLFLSPLQSNSELQWDPDSEPDQGYNCGPSSAEKVANFYKNLLFYGITRTRKLGTSRTKSGTNTTEQKRMLDGRKVPSTVQRLSPSEIKSNLTTSRKPLILWLFMREIPDSIKGSSFDGNHAVAALANGWVDGEPGIWVNEPNQRRGSAQYRAKRFYPDRYWTKASAAIGRYVIVPDKPKVIPTRLPLRKTWVVTSVALNIRSGPSAATADVGTFVKGKTFKSNLIETQGGKYTVNGKVHDEWLGLIRDGKQRWVAKAYCKEA